MQTVRMQYDPFIVDALVQRFPVAGATIADKIRAAQVMHSNGRPIEFISMVLRVHEERTRHWIYKTKVEAMPDEIPDWADQEFPLCRNKLHHMTPTNQKPTAKGVRCRACYTEAMRRKNKTKYWRDKKNG